jgi:hypothetical protein
MEILSVVSGYTTLYLLLSAVLPEPYVAKTRVFLSLLNATLLSALSTRTIMYIIQPNPVANLLEDVQDTMLANYVIGFFSADMLLGYVFTPESMGFLTGYVHHTVYVSLVYYLRTHSHSNLIYLCLPFEIPTLLLDLNRLDSQKRFNGVFAVSFVLCRVIYNIYIIVLMSEISAAYQFIATSMLCIHLYWLQEWTRKQYQIQE